MLRAGIAVRPWQLVRDIDSELEVIQLSIFRERMLTVFWAGEGFFWYQTAAQGKGKVVLVAEGLDEERTLEDERLVVSGNFVVGRTAGGRMSIRRLTKSLLSYYLTGEKYAWVFEGTGKLLLCTMPYLRLRILADHPRDPAMVT